MTSAHLKPASPIWGWHTYTHWNTKHFYCAFTKSNRAGCVRGERTAKHFASNQRMRRLGWGGGWRVRDVFFPKFSALLGPWSHRNRHNSKYQQKQLSSKVLFETRIIFILKQEAWTQSLTWNRTQALPRVGDLKGNISSIVFYPSKCDLLIHHIPFFFHVLPHGGHHILTLSSWPALNSLSIPHLWTCGDFTL